MMSVELAGSALNSSVAFTGRLACMSRAEAFEVVRQRGGTPSPAVTKRTKILIVGELGWPLLDDGRPSNKLRRATAYGIPIVSERNFVEWIDRAVPEGVQRTYSVDQLAALSKMSICMIRELAQLSLLDERDGRFGFRDLASARQIAKLLNGGVRLSEIIRAVSEIRKWLLTDQDALGNATGRLDPGDDLLAKRLPFAGCHVQTRSASARPRRGLFFCVRPPACRGPSAGFCRASTMASAVTSVPARRLTPPPADASGLDAVMGRAPSGQMVWLSSER